VDLPGIYRHFAWAVLALAGFATLRRGTRLVSSRVLVVEALAVLGAVGGVALVQYMTWTAVGSQVIDGIQGRYFLPPALVLAILLEHPSPTSVRPANWLAVPVLIFPILSIVVVMHALIIRYYL